MVYLSLAVAFLPSLCSNIDYAQGRRGRRVLRAESKHCKQLSNATSQNSALTIFAAYFRLQILSEVLNFWSKAVAPSPLTSLPLPTASLAREVEDVGFLAWESPFFQEIIATNGKKAVLSFFAICKHKWFLVKVLSCNLLIEKGGNLEIEMWFFWLKSWLTVFYSDADCILFGAGWMKFLARNGSFWDQFIGYRCGSSTSMEWWSVDKIF